MGLDGIRPVATGESGVEGGAVNIPVNVEGNQANPEAPVVPTVASPTEDPFPIGARTVEADEAAAVTAAAGEIAAVDEAPVVADVSPLPEAAATVADGNNNAARNAIQNIEEPNGAADLERIIGGVDAAKTTGAPSGSIAPAEAPVISAFPEGLDVPPKPTVSTGEATMPDAATNFSSPYPLPENKPASEPITPPSNPQAFIDTSGLPKPPSPSVTEPASLETTVSKRAELRAQEDEIINKMSDLISERREATQRIDKPLTDIGSDLARIKEVDAELDELLKKYQAVRQSTNKLDNPEAKSGEAS